MDNPLYLYDLGYKNVIGVDEAGRGPLAGPVVAAAVILKEYKEELDEINDSKKLTEKKREKLYDIIMENFDVAVGISTVEEIDKLNILNADFLAMRRALKTIMGLRKNEKDKKYIVLVDGNLKIKEYAGEQQAIVKGDSKSLSIAAASIIAKVTRDRLMKDLENLYPEYGFEKHKGYGTKTHIEAIKKVGVIEGVHRRTFLKKILEEDKKEVL